MEINGIIYFLIAIIVIYGVIEPMFERIGDAIIRWKKEMKDNKYYFDKEDDEK